MSDALTAAIAADEARFRDPVVKSEVTTPVPVGAGGEPVTDAPAEAPKPEPEAKAEEKPPEPEKKERNGAQDAIRRLTAKLADKGRDFDATARERDELRARLAALEAAAKPQDGQQPLSQADIDKMVDTKASERAKQMVADQERAREEREFVRACNRVAAAGDAEFGEEFLPTIETLWGIVGPQAQVTLTEAVLETEKPEAVLFHLGNNPEEAERISALKPAKMGAAIAKIANSLSAPPPAQPKTPSRAPGPIEAVTGSVRPEFGMLGPKNIEDWIKWDAERSKSRRSA